MQQSTDLQNLLHSVHKKSYPAYKALKGSYPFNNYILSIDHVQGDPFASPSHISIRIPHKTAGFPKEYYKDSVTSMTLSDYLARQFEKQIVHYTFRAKGSGKSGLISISHCGQEVLKRTACEITEKEIIARFFIGFPANGRTINATELEKIFFRSVYRRPFSTKIQITRNCKRLFFLLKIRPVSESSSLQEILSPLSLTAPFFREKAGFLPVQ